MEKNAQPLYPVYYGNRTGYINSRGERIISPKPFFGHDFSEDLAVVEVRDHGEFSYGFLDHSGRTHIRARFLWAGPFQGGMARVEVKHGAFTFVDPNGKVWPRMFTALRDFSEGLAAASTNGEWGYIDGSGEFVIAQRFTHAGPFSEGLAPVTFAGRVGYIDPAGRDVIPPKFQHAWPFRGGRAAVQLDGQFGFIGRNGEWLIKPVFDAAWPHHEGLARVQDAGYHGFIDHRGEIVVPLNFEDAGDFSEGLAAVRVAGRWGYVDALGHAVIEPRFLGAQPFRHGVARVVVDQFTETSWVPETHTESEARVEVFSYIDKLGREIWPLPSFFNGQPYPKEIDCQIPREPALAAH